MDAVEGIAGIPAEFKARLASDDPSVRGEAFVDVLSLASGAGITAAGGTRFALNQAERLKLNATITQAEQVAIARTKIENNFSADNDGWSNKPSGVNELALGANGGGKVAGEIKILQGATPDANELRAGKGLAEQFGYDVAHQPTASQLGS